MTKKKEEWLSGKPERPALYKCKVNGEETVLQFKKCVFSGRTYWLYTDGSDVDPNAEVLWKPGRTL